MNQYQKELFRESSELLYRANEIKALSQIITNSIRHSVEINEDLSYILTGCEILENKQNELIYLADVHERKCI